ncbi:glycosyltransferase family 2 protein [Alicyclobacillus fastidiosus]|uniref:Glycosyltransferase family 2 protein n=1 Tax=Alicyclobacillus fastidiosus TaxID=392011 RepID=A0ABY6ZIA3_9BACL|nr:glycosyltransferase family 2 protein [Alicyclobacillus fastidiosus]WAH42649.1 glycosyltransferase family 2 protein [Alicyclobacillus fastidiosus]
MLLSACMIVKNERHTIEKCLSSLHGVVDEIIVIDTGSTDNTPDIATQYGAKVFSFTWDNDFSHARNESLRHATGDWILVIDADEYLDETQKLGLRTFLEQTDAEGVFVVQKNYLGSLQHITKSMPIRVMRLFRRGHLYSGAIHEQVADSVQRTGRPIATFDLDLHHIGYTEEFVKTKSKSQRNTNLLKAALVDDPNNLFHRSNLIAEYVLARDFQGSAALAEETFKYLMGIPKNAWPNFAPRIMLHWVASLWEIGQKDKALKVCKDGIQFFPWLTDIKKLYADMLTGQGDWIQAEKVLMECREQGDTKDGLIEVTEGAGTYFSALQLGTVWACLGDDIIARQWYLQAFFENPALESTMFPIVALMPPEPSLLREHIESKIVDAATYGNYAEMYAIRELPDAVSVVGRAEEKFGVSESTVRARMTILRQSGTDALIEYVNKFPSEISHFLLGLYLLDHQDFAQAQEWLGRAGTRGEYILKTHDLLTKTTGSQWGIRLVTRDLVAMRTERLLRACLPFAMDRKDVWTYLRHSPLSNVLSEIQWPGDTPHECEQNALRYFREHNFDQSLNWLDKAESFGKTVTQVLLRCDLALASNDITKARKIVYQGKIDFPKSEVIKNASRIVHPQLDHVQLASELVSRQQGGLLQ